MSVPVIAFLDAYRAAFSSLEADAVMELFHYPCQIVGAGDPPTVRQISSPEAWRPGIERIISIYRRLGVAAARVEKLETVDLAPNLATATVRWQLHAADGSPLHAFNVSYTLVLQGKRARVAALAHDERSGLAEWQAGRGGADAEPV